MSMYADYLRERTSDHIIETAFGWVSYRFIDESTCYVVDIYVVPEERRTGKATELMNLVVERARIHGCSELLGSCQPTTRHSTASLRAQLGYGMQLKSAAQDAIIVRKDI